MAVLYLRARVRGPATQRDETTVLASVARGAIQQGQEPSNEDPERAGVPMPALDMPPQGVWRLT